MGLKPCGKMETGTKSDYATGMVWEWETSCGNGMDGESKYCCRTPLLCSQSNNDAHY